MNDIILIDQKKQGLDNEKLEKLKVNKRREYKVIDLDTRKKLIELTETLKQSIKSSSKELGIKYSEAKYICKQYKVRHTYECLPKKKRKKQEMISNIQGSPLLKELEEVTPFIMSPKINSERQLIEAEKNIDQESEDKNQMKIITSLAKRLSSEDMNKNKVSPPFHLDELHFQLKVYNQQILNTYDNTAL